MRQWAQLRTVFHLMRADFLERVRSYGFLGMLLFTIFVTYLFIPAPGSIQVAGLQLGGYRAGYNSAWIGSMTVLLMGEFFLLFAFYFLRGATERDRRTGVGQILAATPMTRLVYALGKWLSNVAVIGAMVAMIIAAAAALQFIRAEDNSLDFWALISPFLFVLLPALIVIAAAAVLFDCVNWLRGTVGNILFFFIAYPVLTLSLDLAGNTILYPSIYQACAAQFSGCNPTRQIDAGMPPLEGLPIFQYEGVTWSLAIITGRLGLIVVGALIVLLASWAFRRFDPAKENLWLPAIFTRRAKPGPIFRTDSQRTPETAPGPPLRPGKLTTIQHHPPPSLPGVFWRILGAEARLIFKGVRWPWYLIALAILCASWLAPLEQAHRIVLPLAWVWPLALWSGLGTRELRYRTEPVIFSAPHGLQRLLPATLLVGILIALVMAHGIILRLIFAGQWANLLSLLPGAGFIPALALAMGVWSGGSKLFEGAYLFAWYLAAVVGVQTLDFMGRTPGSFERGIPWLYGGLALLLTGIAVLGRRRQIGQ